MATPVSGSRPATPITPELTPPPVSDSSLRRPADAHLDSTLSSEEGTQEFWTEVAAWLSDILTHVYDVLTQLAELLAHCFSSDDSSMSSTRVDEVPRSTPFETEPSEDTGSSSTRIEEALPITPPPARGAPSITLVDSLTRLCTLCEQSTTTDQTLRTAILTLPDPIRSSIQRTLQELPQSLDRDIAPESLLRVAERLITTLTALRERLNDPNTPSTILSQDEFNTFDCLEVEITQYLILTHNPGLIDEPLFTMKEWIIGQFASMGTELWRTIRQYYIEMDPDFPLIEMLIEDDTELDDAESVLSEDGMPPATTPEETQTFQSIMATIARREMPTAQDVIDEIERIRAHRPILLKLLNAITRLPYTTPDAMAPQDLYLTLLPQGMQDYIRGTLARETTETFNTLVQKMYQDIPICRELQTLLATTQEALERTADAEAQSRITDSHASQWRSMFNRLSAPAQYSIIEALRIPAGHPTSTNGRRFLLENPLAEPSLSALSDGYYSIIGV